MLITHKKLQPVQCYHIFSNSMVVYLAKNHYGSYSPQIVPTNPPGSWPIEVFHTCDQNHVTAGAAPFWGSSFATAAVAAVDMI